MPVARTCFSIRYLLLEVRDAGVALRAAHGRIDQMFHASVPGRVGDGDPFPSLTLRTPGRNGVCTLNTPWTPSIARWRERGSSSSPFTHRHVPLDERPGAVGLSGSRVNALTEKPREASSRAVAPPCCPVAPSTRMILSLFDIDQSPPHLIAPRSADSRRDQAREMRLEPEVLADAATVEERVESAPAVSVRAVRRRRPHGREQRGQRRCFVVDHVVNAMRR